MVRKISAAELQDGVERINEPTPLLDPDWRHVTRLAADAGVVPGDPARQPLDAAREANWSFNMFWNTGLPLIARARDTWLAGPAGPFRTRVIYPAAAVQSAAVPVLFYFHGGGFAMNGLDTHERVMRLLGLRARAAVVGVGYHLAPEHRYPCQLDEALAAFDWIIDEADTLGLDRNRIGVAGDSAGATLALSLMLRLRDLGRVDAVKLGLLFYGMYSTETDTVSHRKFGQPPFGLTSEKVSWFWNAYLPDAASKTDPVAVPLFGDFAGLPHIVLAAAGLDCLRDDTLGLAERLEAASVSYSLASYDRLPHSFLQQSAFVAASERALSAAAEEAAEIFGSIPTAAVVVESE
jgi:acetyl esterase